MSEIIDFAQSVISSAKSSQDREVTNILKALESAGLEFDTNNSFATEKVVISKNELDELVKEIPEISLPDTNPEKVASNLANITPEIMKGLKNVESVQASGTTTNIKKE